jgi:hypothetical protein
MKNNKMSRKSKSIYSFELWNSTILWQMLDAIKKAKRILQRHRATAFHNYFFKWSCAAVRTPAHSIPLVGPNDILVNQSNVGPVTWKVYSRRKGKTAKWLAVTWTEREELLTDFLDIRRWNVGKISSLILFLYG